MRKRGYEDETGERGDDDADESAEEPSFLVRPQRAGGGGASRVVSRPVACTT